MVSSSSSPISNAASVGTGDEEKIQARNHFRSLLPDDKLLCIFDQLTTNNEKLNHISSLIEDQENRIKDL